MKKKNIINNSKGATLLEVILVMAIMGVLMSIIMVDGGPFIHRAKRVRALADGRAFFTAVQAVAGEFITEGRNIYEEDYH